MIELVPFNPVHLKHLELIPEQEHMQEWLQDEAYVQLLTDPVNMTALADGEVIGCGGIFMMGHIARAWALVSPKAGPHMLMLTRVAQKFLPLTYTGRIDTVTRSDYAAGARWLGLLGFINETPAGMLNYGLNGESYDLYRLVRDDDY